MPFKDIALAVLVILIWGGNTIAIKTAVTELPPVTALAIRFGLTALVFLPFMKWPGKDVALKFLGIAILMGVFHQGFLFTGMNLLSAGLTSIFLQTQVIFSAVLGALLFRERIGWRTIIGIILGIIGIFAIYGDSTAGFTVSGFWFIIASAGFIALSYGFMKTLPPVKPATFLCLVNGFAFPFILMIAAGMELKAWDSLPQANWSLLTIVFAFQVFIVGLSHIIWQRLLARNDLSLVTPFTLLLPVFGVALAVILLGENVSWRMLLGGGITLSGVAIIVFRRASKKIEAV